MKCCFLCFQFAVLGTIINQFVDAFATFDWQIYVGSLPGILGVCITTLVRSMITKLVGSSEIGKVLAVNGCIQVVLTSYSIYLYFLTYSTCSFYAWVSMYKACLSFVSL